LVCCVPALLKSEDRYAEFAGRYENQTFAYSAAIPGGLVGSKTKPPAPAHGFFIELPGRPETRIDVNADYNTMDYASGRDASAGETQWFVKQCSSEVRTESAMTTLGSLPAFRTRIRCRRRESSLLLDSIVALREAPVASERMLAVLYSVSLVTSQEQYLADQKIFEQVLRSFQISRTKP
jgi:hypothetical protein